MAKRDIREYYAKCIAQKISLEADFKDFEEALAAGYITEDRLTEIKEEYTKIQENVDRLAYIVYLLDLPNKKDKNKKYRKSTQDIETAFDELNASEMAILSENNTVIKQIREALKKLKEETGK